LSSSRGVRRLPPHIFVEDAYIASAGGVAAALIARTIKDAPMTEGSTRSTHIQDAVQAIARLRVEHDRKTTPLQRIVGGLTGRAGSPEFVVLLTFVLVAWIGLNSALLFLGRRPIDAPPFFWMQGAVSLAALYMTVLILATQRRENELASHHEHLTLELAILSEQKTAKIISLLEELRQDHPDIHDRIDDEAVAMSEPANPQSVLETIKKHTVEFQAVNPAG
jgi:uncharacterized membrane protein